MKTIFLPFFFALTISSCSTNNSSAPEEPANKIIVYNSLKDELYGRCKSILDLEDKFDKLFERTGELLNNKESYSNFFQKMEKSNLGSFSDKLIFTEGDSLTTSDKEKLWDLNETNYLDCLFRTCLKFQNSHEFSEDQRVLVNEFSFDSYAGIPDLQKISNSLSEMTELEFQSNGIKQCCMIYIVEYFAPKFMY